MAISQNARVEKFKQWLMYAIVLAIVVVFMCLITPIGPGMYRAKIDKYNKVGEPVKPWATESMYGLGRFYQMTMRSESALETYKELIDVWYDENGEAMQIPERDLWVGRAMYWRAELLWDAGFHLQAKEMWNWFLSIYDTDSGMDTALLEAARARTAAK